MITPLSQNGTTTGAAPIYNFVLCSSYHGATLLSCLLNNHSQITALGDLLPSRRFLDRAVCGCGKTIRDCEFWDTLDRRVNPSRSQRDNLPIPLYPVVLENERANRLAMRGLAYLSLHSSPGVWRLIGPQARTYVERYRELYRTACEMQGTTCFLDGQKSLPKLSIFMATAGRQNVRTIHLVRDPRAVYYSYIRRNRPADLTRFARHWRTTHGRIIRLSKSMTAGRYLRLKHEDLCADPVGQMDRIQDFLELERQTLVRASTAAADKHVIGNEMLKAFDGIVREDTRWRDALSRADQDILVHHASPVFAELGYRR